jgi:hypothetical protein
MLRFAIMSFCWLSNNLSLSMTLVVCAALDPGPLHEMPLVLELARIIHGPGDSDAEGFSDE